MRPLLGNSPLSWCLARYSQLSTIQRIFFHLAYQGTAYHGWQSQADPTLPTVQSTLETCLQKMLGYPVHLHGCGRTDAGVHACSYYAHFDQRAPLDYDPVFRLNRVLPDDMRCTIGYR